MLEDIKKINNEINEEIISIFNMLHENPELSFKEHHTSELITSYLDSINIPYRRIGQTSIIGILECSKKGRTIALRSDIDALPIEEDSNHAICSQNKGVMHACGHDFHIATLLGTAKTLNSIKEKLSGNILFIFQAGEELLPGGAKEIIESGIFDEYKPEWIGAIHCEPDLTTGKIGIKEGMYMASGDEIFLTVKGQGGHAAMPHKTADTVLIASEIIVSLQQITSRHCPPQIPSVLTFGKIVGNGAVNIIPKEVNIEGTFRTMNEEWRTKAKKLINTIAKSIAENHGAECDVNIIDGYPFLRNNIEYTQKVKKIAIETLGKQNVVDLDIRMTTEDFAYYSQKIKSTFFRVGVGNKDTENSPLHTSTFKADKKALKYSITILSTICSKFLI